MSEVAAELGASPSQVAIAWTLARSRAVHPIVGARDAEQLADNLGAVDVDLPRGALERLDAVTGFDPGYPADSPPRCPGGRRRPGGGAHPHGQG